MSADRRYPQDYLDMIHKELDGVEWDSQTLENIAAILQDAGYSAPRPPSDVDLDDSLGG